MVWPNWYTLWIGEGNRKLRNWLYSIDLRTWSSYKAIKRNSNCFILSTPPQKQMLSKKFLKFKFAWYSKTEMVKNQNPHGWQVVCSSNCDSSSRDLKKVKDKAATERDGERKREYLKNPKGVRERERGRSESEWTVREDCLYKKNVPALLRFAFFGQNKAISHCYFLIIV